MRALGAIVANYEGVDSTHVVRCGFLDYYDHWSEIDPRLERHYPHLSRAAGIFGHDLVHQATYVHEILSRLPIKPSLRGESVVTVGSMTEAFLVSVRSAYDAIAIAIGYIACEKPGQAPQGSLGDLIAWALRNAQRGRSSVLELLDHTPKGFWELRAVRDQIVHQGADVTIHCDNRQFNLWLRGPQGWITREPLLPFLARHHRELLSFADAASQVINTAVALPADRLSSRAVEGVFIGSLHRLQAMQADYAAPST